MNESIFSFVAVCCSFSSLAMKTPSVRDAFGQRSRLALQEAALAQALGARFSSAQASRWRAVGRWLSQHPTLQKNSAVRGRLQVDTLHA